MASINAEKQPLLGDDSSDKKHYGHNVPVAAPVPADADGISSRSGSVSSHTSGTSTQCCRTSGLIRFRQITVNTFMLLFSNCLSCRFTLFSVMEKP